MKSKEDLAIELVFWMLSGEEGSITYVCLDKEEASAVYEMAITILKGILLKIRWEGTDADTN